MRQSWPLPAREALTLSRGLTGSPWLSSSPWMRSPVLLTIPRCGLLTELQCCLCLELVSSRTLVLLQLLPVSSLAYLPQGPPGWPWLW